VILAIGLVCVKLLHFFAPLVLTTSTGSSGLGFLSLFHLTVPRLKSQKASDLDRANLFSPVLTVSKFNVRLLRLSLGEHHGG